MSSTQEVGDIFGAGKGPANAMLRSPTVLIVAIGLWGMNLFFFRLFGINYKYVLTYDLLKEKQQQQDNEPSGSIPPPPSSQQNHHSRSTSSTSITTSRQSPPTSGALHSPQNGDSTAEKDNNIVMLDESIQMSHEVAADLYPAFESSSNVLSGARITWFKLVLFSLILLLMLHLTTHLWMDYFGRGVIGAILFFYTSLLIYIFVPLSSNQWLRKAFYITLQRTGALIYPRCWCFRHTTPSNPPREVPFIDVFYADAMCSLSKVFFDWGILLHMASHYPEPVPQAAHNIIIPSMFAAVPFLIRARQCLLMYSIGKLKQDPKRYQHVANAIKYSTSIWPLLVSAYQKTLLDPVAAKSLDKYLYLLQTINALYALYWDIVMDWGMMQNPQELVSYACASTSGLVAHRAATEEVDSKLHAVPSPRKGLQCYHLLLRPRLRFGLAMSAMIALSDAVLRFSWLLRFVSHYLFVSQDAFVLCTQFLEVFRRSIWNLLRVEWENIKQKSKQLKARDSLSDTDEEEQDLFLMEETGTNTNAAPTSVEQEMVALIAGKNGSVGNTATTTSIGTPISPTSGRGIIT